MSLVDINIRSFLKNNLKEKKIFFDSDTLIDNIFFLKQINFMNFVKENINILDTIKESLEYKFNMSISKKKR